MSEIILVFGVLDRLNFRLGGTFRWQPDAIPLEQDFEIRVGSWVSHMHKLIPLDRSSGHGRRSGVIFDYCFSGG